MRPAILFRLFGEIRALSGVGPKLEKLITKVAGPRLVDLIFDLPVGVIDRSYRPKLIAAEPGRIATVMVGVLDHLPARVKSQPYKVRVSDDSAAMELIFFRADAKYLTEILPPGSKRIVSGRIERFKDKLQMPHPDYVVADEAGLPQHEPVYGLTEGLPGKSLAKAIRGALERVPPLPEWQDAAFLKREAFAPFAEALAAAHVPEHEGDLSPETPVRRRLAYDELLANQLALMLIRAQLRGRRGGALQAMASCEVRRCRPCPLP